MNKRGMQVGALIVGLVVLPLAGFVQMGPGSGMGLRSGTAGSGPMMQMQGMMQQMEGMMARMAEGQKHMGGDDGSAGGQGAREEVSRDGHGLGRWRAPALIER